MKTCSVAGCVARVQSLGLCNMHYQRWRKHGDALHIPIRSFRRPVKDRLFANTITTALGCIQKAGATEDSGYGLLQVGGKTLLAHRVSYEISNGGIPEGMQVLHRCDNKPCINPAHLFAGTQLDNMHDMRSKGRKVVLRGEAAPAARLTRSDVEAIRASTEKQSVLARAHNVDPSNISRIKSGDTWA